MTMNDTYDILQQWRSNMWPMSRTTDCASSVNVVYGGRIARPSKRGTPHSDLYSMSWKAYLEDSLYGAKMQPVKTIKQEELFAILEPEGE